MMKHIGESPYHQLRTDSGRRGLGEAPMERKQNGLAEQAVQMETGRRSTSRRSTACRGSRAERTAAFALGGADRSRPAKVVIMER